jgi:hypothetical protein
MTTTGGSLIWLVFRSLLVRVYKTSSAVGRESDEIPQHSIPSFSSETSARAVATNAG